MDLRITLMARNKANLATVGAWRKGLLEVQPSDLGEALCDGVCLVPLYHTIGSTLYAERHRLLTIFWPLGCGTLAAHTAYLHLTQLISVKYPIPIPIPRFPVFLHIG